MSIIVPYQKLMKPEVGCELDFSHDLSSGLVQRYLMNEGGGDSVYDLLRNSRATANVSVPSWIGGLDGVVPNFNGSSNYYNTFFGSSLSTLAFIHNTVVFTISIKAKFNDNTTRQCMIGSTATTGEKGFLFLYENFGGTPGTKAIRMLITPGTISQYIKDMRTADNAITDNLEHHIVVRSRTTGNSLDINIDGKPYATQVVNSSTVGTISGDSTRNALFGVSNGSTLNFYLNGTISDIQIFNTYISDDYVEWIYTEPYANIIQPLRRSYFFPFNNSLSRRRLQGTQNTPRIIGSKGVGVF